MPVRTWTTAGKPMSRRNPPNSRTRGRLIRSVAAWAAASASASCRVRSAAASPLHPDVDVTCAAEIGAGADVAAGQARAGDGDLDADRVLAWLARGAAAGDRPQDSCDLVVGRAVRRPVRDLAFFQRGAVV